MDKMEFKLAITLHEEEGGVAPWDIADALRSVADWLDNCASPVPLSNGIVNSEGVLVGHWEVVGA